MNDRDRWNERHQSAAGGDRGPDPGVTAVLDALGPGRGRRALDLASGTGRHALELARRGYRAEAWDVSDVALARATERASAEGLELAVRRIDLVTEPLPPERFALVVLVDFLERDLLARVSLLLEPGGSLVFVTFTLDWPDAHPSERYRLGRGELSSGIAGLDTLAVWESDGRAGLHAVR